MARPRRPPGTADVSGRNRTLVTGAGGFVGRRLVASLRANGGDVRAWTRSDGDLRDSDAVRSALAEMKPDVIYHLASVLPSAGEESWSLIADEQRMLANLAYAMPAHCRLVYTGSMAEYGRSGTFSERHRCAPDTAYGCAKFSGTNLGLALRASHGLDIRVARLFAVYGPGETPARLLPWLIGKLRTGEAVPLSDGAQRRDFVHVDDVCAALAALADAAVENDSAISNIGTGIGVTVRQVCEAVADILGADPALLQFGAMARRAVDQDCLIADVGRMQTFTTPPRQRWLDRDLSEEIVRAMIANDGT